MGRLYALLLTLVLGCILSPLAAGQGKLSLFDSLKPITIGPAPLQLPEPGKPCVLFVFKACCTPADQAARWAVQAHGEVGDRIEFLGLNVDPGRSVQRVPAWLRRHNVPFPVLADPTTEVARAWGVLVPPVVIVLDAQGEEVYRTMGFVNSYGRKLDEILRGLVVVDSTERAE